MAEEPPDYTVYRSRPKGLRERLAGSDAPVAAPRRTPQPKVRRKKKWTPWRVVKLIVVAALGWLAVSFVLFCVSAQMRAGEGIPSSAEAALAKGGIPPLTPTTILVLGSDKRPKGSKEPGANSAGQRSDTIMLLRIGGGANSKLSIPRDTVVPISGHGNDKINAAYAYGGAALSIQTIQDWTGVTIDHLVEVSLENFPKFIDALGGIDVNTPCVISDINGGTRNGGYSLRLSKGEHHLSGKQALALARTRHNRCIAAYSDLDRVKQQQVIFGGIRDRMLTPGAFVRLPWAAWNAPQAIRTDMGAAGLLGVMSAVAVSGSPPPHVMKPSGVTTSPGGGAGLVVDDAEKQREVDQFMNG